MLRVFAGYDQREAACFHVFSQSVIENTGVPVSITPLHGNMLNFDGQQDGTNAFIYSRYLVPYLCNYEGFAIFCDGDMVVRDDLANLWNERDPDKAVQVVKHDYVTKEHTKYIDTPLENQNINYPRKNQSSVMIWNCGHPSNRILTREYVAEAGGAILHRFQFLKDEEIGGLDPSWNHLVREYEYSPDAKLVHWTLGSPGFGYYAFDDYCDDWGRYLLNAIEMAGEVPVSMIDRATQQRRFKEVA